MANLDLKQLRQKIDHLDNELAQVFEARLELVRQVARYKQEQGLKVRDNSREAVVLAQCATRVKNPAYVAGLQQLMQQIMTISRELETADMQEQQAGRPAAAMPPQEPTVLTVGYQGVPGAYSQVALTQYFADYQVQEKNYPLFEDVALAVSKGELDY
ncbi:MAG: chorismate mutase, partial [Acidaminococcaceae bacterium]